jgi:hypothetical protein
MITIENVTTAGWEAAIRGMRNPMNSWHLSDSGYCSDIDDCEECNGKRRCKHYSGESIFPNPDYILGPKDHNLMMSLRSAGTDHRKYMRMIVVWCDITAPLYFWKEFDTYKVGTVANSCSTMHKIHAKEFVMDDFSHELLTDEVIGKYQAGHKDDGFVYFTMPKAVLEKTISALNVCREKYINTKDKRYFDQMIQLLPSSYNQRRTLMFSYEVLANMYRARKHHKLQEWRDFCTWIETLPYSEIITGEV